MAHQTHFFDQIPLNQLVFNIFLRSFYFLSVRRLSLLYIFLVIIMKVFNELILKMFRSLILFLTLLQLTTSYNNLNELKGYMENRTRTIASAVQGIMKNKCQKQKFYCPVKSFDICSGTAQRSCLNNFPTSKLCDGIGKFSLTSGIRIPNYFDTANLTEQTKYFICKTAEPQLQDVYKRLLNQNSGHYGWIGFSFSDGSHRVSPGFKYGKQSTTASCKDYDPRLRPWFATNVYQRKNMIILVQNSKSIHEMPDRFNSIKYCVQALLKTADRGDYFNIIQFSDAPKALLSEKDLKLVSLNEEMKNFKGDGFYQSITSKISKSSSVERDYMQALQMAVQILANSKNENRDNENLILMFSGFQPQNYNSTNGVSEFEQFLTKKQEQLKMNFLFFGFGVSMIQQSAKELLKNISCSFDGIFFQIPDIKYESQFIDKARGFYDYLIQGNQMRGFRWTDIYEDAFGLGQMSSVVNGAYYEQNGVTRLIGLSVVDVLLSQLLVYKTIDEIRTSLEVTQLPFKKNITICQLENIRRNHRCTKPEDSGCPLKKFCQPSLSPKNDSIIRSPVDTSDVSCCLFQESSKAGLIAGLVVGITLSILLVGFFVWFLILRKTNKSSLELTYAQIFKQFSDFDHTRIRSQSEISMIKD